MLLFESPEQVPLQLIESRTLDNGVLAFRYTRAQQATQGESSAVERTLRAQLANPSKEVFPRSALGGRGPAHEVRAPAEQDDGSPVAVWSRDQPSVHSPPARFPG